MVELRKNDGKEMIVFLLTYLAYISPFCPRNKMDELSWAVKES